MTLSLTEIKDLIVIAKAEGLLALSLDGLSITLPAPTPPAVPFFGQHSSSTTHVGPPAQGWVNTNGVEQHSAAHKALEQAAERLSARDLRFTASG